MYFGESVLNNKNEIVNELTVVEISIPFVILGGLIAAIAGINKASKKKQEKKTDSVKQQLSSNPELKSSYDKLIKELQKDLSYVLKPYTKYIKFNTDFKVWGKDTQLLRYENFCIIDAAKLFKDTYNKDFYTYAQEDNGNPDVAPSAPEFIKQINIIKKNIKTLNKSISKITKSQAIEFDYETVGNNDSEFKFYYDKYIKEGFSIQLVIDIDKFDNIKLPEYR